MLISRAAMEAATACLTAAIGLAACIGSMEFGTSWSESGPEPGYFPFFVGLILVAGSVVNFGAAIAQRRGRQSFIDGEQARRFLQFLLPMAGFVIVAIVLGLYVGTALYLSLVMWRQGGYRLVHSVAVGIGVAAFFYLMFDVWFRVPLLKGPLESLLGIY